MRTEIRSLHQRLKTTSIYVTHDQIEAMTMADRIVVLRDGRVEQMGSPAELYDRPCNTFVAGFIGSPAMNLIAANVDLTGAIVDFGGEVGLADDLRTAPGQRLTLGLRPEHLRVLPADAPGIPCVVEVLEFSGADTLISCAPLDAGKATAVGSNQIQALVHDRLAVKVGERISLGIAPELVHVFDAASGERL
jgi:multiple sugar transport system ATP-binding protein